jgi:Tfp pilus assembly PilM family ATPase
LARYLALDWDHNQLYVVAATVGKGGVRVERAAVWPEERSPNPADAEALGKRLKERLREAGIAPAPVLVAVGRDRVIIKDVLFPQVPEAEEPAIVRFQAVKELTEPPDEVVLDYLVRERPGPNGERQAWAFILRKELVAAYQTLCKAAGLKLVGVTPRPLGVVTCLQRVPGTTVLTPAPEPGGAAAVLTVTEHWAEIIVAHDGAIVLTRSMTPGPNLAGEARRNLAVYNGQWPQLPVKTVYVAGGGEHAALRERLHELLGVPVHPLDPFGGIERPEVPATGRGGFAGALGLLHARAERHGLRVNFAKPKQPKPPKDPNRKKIFIGAGIAAAALVAFVATCMAKLAAAQVQIDALTMEKINLDKQLLETDVDEKRIKALQDWADGEVVWLDELYDLTDRFPEPTNIRLTRLTADPVARTGKGKYAARMMLTGVTGDLKKADDLTSRLTSDGYYGVKPPQTSRNTGPDRLRGFSQQFALPVDVAKRPSEKYIRRLSVTPREGRQGDGTGMDLNFGDFGGQP